MLIFDMDGVLTDSNGIWKQVDIDFLAKRGMPYTREYYEGVAHTVLSKAAVFTKAYCHLSESCEEIIAEWMEMAGDVYATDVPAKPYVREYLEKCRKTGERMVVLTSAVPSHCRAALTHLGLLPYFETIYFAQELGLDKQSPAIYQKVLSLLGIAPSDCTVFDDSIAACRSAKAVGMKVIGVYDAFFHVSWEEMQSACDQTIKSFEELL